MSSCGFLVLAAGLSQRFGGKKLLAPLPNGLTVIEATLLQLPKSSPIHIVCRPSQIELREKISELTNKGLVDAKQLSYSGTEDLVEGMGNSIACGIQATSHWKGWVICLADMPSIKTDTYAQIIQALQRHSIATPVIEQNNQWRQGNPVGFTSEHFESLSELNGTSGARAIVRANKDKVYKVSVKDPGILLDIDYPDDINKHHL